MHPLTNLFSMVERVLPCPYPVQSHGPFAVLGSNVPLPRQSLQALPISQSRGVESIQAPPLVRRRHHDESEKGSSPDCCHGNLQVGLQRRCDWAPGNQGSSDQEVVAGSQGDQGVAAC